MWILQPYLLHCSLVYQYSLESADVDYFTLIGNIIIIVQYIQDVWMINVSLTRTGTRMMNGFSNLSWSWTPDALSCKRSLNSKFHRKSPDIYNKKYIFQINGVSYRLQCQFTILIMTKKTPEVFQTLCTERFVRRETLFENGTLLRCSKHY